MRVFGKLFAVRCRFPICPQAVLWNKERPHRSCVPVGVPGVCGKSWVLWSCLPNFASLSSTFTHRLRPSTHCLGSRMYEPSLLWGQRGTSGAPTQPARSPATALHSWSCRPRVTGTHWSWGAAEISVGFLGEDKSPLLALPMVVLVPARIKARPAFPHSTSNPSFAQVGMSPAQPVGPENVAITIA